MRKHKNILSLFICLSITGLLFSQSGYDIIYEANREGQKIAGSLEELNAYVKAGAPLRVGWVLTFLHPLTKEPTEMEHWTDASFITLLDGHVFSQVRSIYEQGPSFSTPPGVFLANGKPNGWVAILGTTGVMRQKYDMESAKKSMEGSGMTEKEITDFLIERETMKVHTKWAVAKEASK